MGEKDPDGGPFPAYPSGKCWDEASGKTGSGKKFYANELEGKDVPTQPFYVAIITPVIHYCMGGLVTTPDGECVKNGKKLDGLFVAGEAAGGVHGNNRLGGNSLLDCVVFGRVAGRTASKYMSGEDGKFRMYPIERRTSRCRRSLSAEKLRFGCTAFHQGRHSAREAKGCVSVFS